MIQLAGLLTTTNHLADNVSAYKKALSQPDAAFV